MRLKRPTSETVMAAASSQDRHVEAIATIFSRSAARSFRPVRPARLAWRRTSAPADQDGRARAPEWSGASHRVWTPRVGARATGRFGALALPAPPVVGDGREARSARSPTLKVPPQP